MVLLTIVLLMGVMPASALGAVTMTWERNWGSYADADELLSGQFHYPTDVAADKWGNVYVAGGESGDHRIQMFSASGVFQESVGTVLSPSALLENPCNVTVDRWGRIYVTERGNGFRVHIFNPELYNDAGTFDGSGESAIGTTEGIVAALDGTIYVLNGGSATGGEIMRWSRQGAYLSQWAIPGEYATGIAAAQDGDVYAVTDQDNAVTQECVLKYDAFGGPLGVWGGPGAAQGLFLRPSGVGTDPLENVYVVESQGARGQVFESDGTYQTVFGSSGVAADQFWVPYDIGVGLDRNVYVVDNSANRISKWKASVPSTAVSVAGATRYETAVAASIKAYPDGCDYVVIATGANWPDALGGAALAGAADAPLLLTGKDSLPTVVRDEIIRLDAHYAYVLGGKSVISDTVITQLQSLTMMTNRLWGDNRYLTANAIAAETVSLLGSEYDGTAFVATGQNFPDALAASPISASNGWPIYLTPTASLDANVRAAMLANGSNHGYILGGPNAVSASVAAALETMSPLPPGAFTRIAGNDRYETAAKIAQEGFDGMGMLWSRPAIAIGTNFPDALAGGVLQGSDYSVLLLTPPTGLNGFTAAKLSANRDSIYEMRFLGGPTVLPQAVRNSAMALLH